MQDSKDVKEDDLGTIFEEENAILRTANLMRSRHDVNSENFGSLKVNRNLMELHLRSVLSYPR